MTSSAKSPDLLEISPEDGQLSLPCKAPIKPGHGSVHLTGLDKMSTHVMGFEPMIKVLSTYILTDQLVNPRVTMPHPVIHGLTAQLVNHWLHHALNAGLLEGLVVDQNQGDPRGVSPKTTTDQ